MRSYIVRRIITSIFIIWLVVSFSFFLIRLMPGNAMTYMYIQLLQAHAGTPQQIMEELQVIYGVNMKAPLYVQYFTYLANALHGDFGMSTLYPGTPVMKIIDNAIPWTILSISFSIVLSFVIGNVLGVLMAYYRKSWLAGAVTAIVTILHAIPNYIIALIALYWFVDLHPVLPVGGAYGVTTTPGFNGPFIASVALHLVLPTGAYVVTTIGGWALGMKSSTVGALGAEYIVAANARGVREARIVRSYVARNAILPQITGLGLTIGFMFGGSVFIETMFNYPGIGYYMITAVNGRDYSLMMAIFILTTSAVVVANLLTDLVYGKFDPRITVGKE